jgi:hypothetical protein
VVAVEVSTGEVVHGEFFDGASRSGLEAVLLGLAPVEVILGTPLSFSTEKVCVLVFKLQVYFLVCSPAQSLFNDVQNCRSTTVIIIRNAHNS